jgi:ubiquinone/menaquinone biosynthesis C-methylase UbiE
MDLHDFPDVAENYDLYVAHVITQDYDSTVTFHLDLAQQYGQQGILDIGCGTGATLLPLIEHGFRVTGLDISEAMLSVLRRKLTRYPGPTQDRARLVCANMTEFDLPERFSLVIVPRSAFLHLLTERDQEAALHCIHRHLARGGVLSFNTFDPNYSYIAANLKGAAHEPVLRTEYINSRGNREQIWNITEYDPATQIIHITWRFDEFNAEGERIDQRERPLRLRWSFEPEIRYLLRLCGFEVLATYAAYDKTPKTYGSGIVWITRRQE